MEATTNGSVTALINIFTVEPARQRALVALLKSGTDSFFSKMPGYVSSCLLIGQDGRRVVNYSQWRGADDIAAFRCDPRFAPYIQQLRALAAAESIECEPASPA